jgi:hypothetical protein
MIALRNIINLRNHQIDFEELNKIYTKIMKLFEERITF